MPRPLTALIGRRSEVAEVAARLATAHLVTLTGMGGVGKTRLALQVAEDTLEQFPDGIWFVDLAAVTDPAMVPQAVATALGVREEPAQLLASTLLHALGSSQHLLLLDNCEHLAASCAALAGALLSECPHLRVLATSRQPLGVPGEVEWRVPPLSVDEAVQLFVERAAAVRLDFSLTRQNRAAVGDVCRWLEGIPLAIELAAARLKVVSLEQIAVRLSNLTPDGAPGPREKSATGLGLLAGPNGRAPRQQTLRATLDWSYDLLSEPERALLLRLSVFVCGCTLEAAEAVCADCGLQIADCGLAERAAVPGETVECDEVAPRSAIRNPSTRFAGTRAIRNEEVLDLLAGLVDRSLVTVEERAAEAQYRLLEMTRQYARERLAERGETDQTCLSHSRYYLGLAELGCARLEGPGRREWLDRLEAAHDNLRAALEWTLHPGGTLAPSRASPPETEPPCASGTRHGQPPTLNARLALGLRLAGILGQFWYIRGYWSEGRRWLERALASGAGRQSGDPARRDRAAALVGAAMLSRAQRDCIAARSSAEAGLTIYEAIGDCAGIARALSHVAWVDHQQGDYAAARRRHEESLRLRRELGDPLDVAGSLNNLGSVAFLQGDHAAARAYPEQALAIFRQLGKDGASAWALGGLGDVACAEGDLPAAWVCYAESLTLCRAEGLQEGMLWRMADLARVAAASAKGPWSSILAARLLGAAQALNERLGAHRPPHIQDDLLPALAAARAALGEAAFQVALNEGRGMTAEEAVNIALRPLTQEKGSAAPDAPPPNETRCHLPT